MKFLLQCSLCLFLTWPCFAAEVVIDVKLNPGGDFKARTSDIEGKAIRTGDKYQAENIRVKVANLKTGIELRDSHTKKHLDSEKFPEVILLKAEGAGGNGTGRIKIRGVEKNISGTYEIKGKDIVASFNLKLSDYGITGIKYMGVGVNDEVKVTAAIPWDQSAAKGTK